MSALLSTVFGQVVDDIEQIMNIQGINSYCQLDVHRSLLSWASQERYWIGAEYGAIDRNRAQKHLHPSPAIGFLLLLSAFSTVYL
jgi:hypothetical protein